MQLNIFFQTMKFVQPLQRQVNSQLNKRHVFLFFYLTTPTVALPSNSTNNLSHTYRIEDE